MFYFKFTAVSKQLYPTRFSCYLRAVSSSWCGRIARTCAICQIQDGGRPPSWKISNDLEWVIRSTFMKQRAALQE